MYNYQNENYFQNITPNMRNNQPSLYSPEEGYNKGNLFQNLYDPYKNYQPVKLQAKNDKEALFLELSKYSFAAHELNLYLDVHPDDDTMLTLFNDYRMRSNQLMMEYEKKYGPLTVSSDDMESSFLWVKNQWPWEGGDK